MGKLTNSKAIFNSFLYVYQRVTVPGMNHRCLALGAARRQRSSCLLPSLQCAATGLGLRRGVPRSTTCPEKTGTMWGCYMQNVYNIHRKYNIYIFIFICILINVYIIIYRYRNNHQKDRIEPWFATILSRIIYIYIYTVLFFYGFLCCYFILYILCVFENMCSDCILGLLKIIFCILPLVHPPFWAILSDISFL